MTFTIVSITGSILAIAGTCLVGLQIVWKRREEQQMRSISTRVGPVQFVLKTSFPGLLIAALGVVLLVVSAITGK